jgi:small-conductance mechanosensitive channel
MNAHSQLNGNLEELLKKFNACLEDSKKTKQDNEILQSSLKDLQLYNEKVVKERSEALSQWNDRLNKLQEDCGTLINDNKVLKSLNEGILGENSTLIKDNRDLKACIKDLNRKCSSFNTIQEELEVLKSQLTLTNQRLYDQEFLYRLMNQDYQELKQRNLLVIRDYEEQKDLYSILSLENTEIRQ